MDSIEFQCGSCGETLEARDDAAGRTVECPSCAKPIRIPFSTTIETTQAPMPPPVPEAAPNLVPVIPPTARIRRKVEMVGAGCLVQGLGILLCFVAFPIGLIVGIILLLIGGRMAIKYVCGSCGNKIADIDVKICPVCKILLTRR